VRDPKVWWKLFPWSDFPHWVPLHVFIEMVRNGCANPDGQLRLFK
jgi:hypothetical protein